MLALRTKANSLRDILSYEQNFEPWTETGGAHFASQESGLHNFKLIQKWKDA